jgi:hypothetical protein
MGEVTSFRRRRSGVAFEPPPSTADRLRARIVRRDRLARDLAAEDAAIAIEARRYADERGEFIRPTVDQLRKRLMGDG